MFIEAIVAGYFQTKTLFHRIIYCLKRKSFRLDLKQQKPFSRPSAGNDCQSEMANDCIADLRLQHINYVNSTLIRLVFIPLSIDRCFLNRRPSQRCAWVSCVAAKSRHAICALHSSTDDSRAQNIHVDVS